MMPRPDPVLVSELQTALTNLERAQRGGAGPSLPQAQQRLLDLAGSVPAPQWLAALDRAVGSNKKRRQASAFLLVQLSETPEVQARVAADLQGSDSEWRSWLIQNIGQSRSVALAPLLNRVIQEDPSSLCRSFAVKAAGELRQTVNLPALLELAQAGEVSSNLIWALKEFATAECAEFLAAWFQDTKLMIPDRVVAAWGLAKLGDREAHRYLIKMLDDPDVVTPTSYKRGESLRAAQALADVHGFPFTWEKGSVAVVKEQLAKADAELGPNR